MSAEQHARGRGHLPLGIRAVDACCGGHQPSRQAKIRKLRWYQAWAMLLTFLTYMSYHLTRKPVSVVKTTLNPKVEYNTHGDPITNGWQPFDAGHVGSNGYHEAGKANLGLLDTAFLFAYAVGMFFSGHVGDRSSLRIYLTFGMLGVGMLSVLLGMAYFWNIHQLWYFVFVQATMGLFQSTGWPSVVSIMGRWFPRGKRGLLMGIWNAHTSVGNILGSVIPGAVLAWGWGWSFIVPGAIIAGLGLLVFFTMVEFPEDLDLPSPEELELEKDGHEKQPLLIGGTLTPKPVHQPIKFVKALKIPGVVAFALSLFFCKLVAYTFLYWLPFYIKHNPIGGKDLSSSQSAYLSTLFDAGGIVGGTLAGYISDRSRKPALVSVVYLLLSVPVLLMYERFGSDSFGLTVGLLLCSGFLVNGPYALITTAVSADLGTHESLAGNPLALATVTAIIDGTGSIGAALGPYLAGAIPNWTNTFYMLMGSLVAAALLLAPTIIREFRESRRGAPVFVVNEA